ncbi:hypothetical protein V8E51_015062 [Hyaloscypha variabilis]
MAEFIKYCKGSSDTGIHSNSIEDGLLHFFACLKFSEREGYLESLQGTERLELRQRIVDELARTARLRKIFEAEGLKTETGRLLKSFKATLHQQFQRRRARQKSSESEPSSHVPITKSKNLDDEVTEVVLGDLRANVIYFKKRSKDAHPHPYDHPELEGTFPNQRVPLGLLLRDNPKNPLMWKCEEDMIRYFHIPANNMSWVEEAIARYYNETKPDLDGPYRKPPQGVKESKTRMLLRPQFWRGLQHGDRPDLPTHTRHMRPRCYPISTDHENSEPKPKNLMLFMPYLHWETDRRRLKSAEILKRHGLAKWSPFSDIVDNALDPAVETNMDRVDSDGLLESITTTSRAGRISSKTVKITHQSKSQKKNLLGILLLKAAALFEAMDGFADEKLIEKHLSRRPPLHPRRTLDQSYYWTLKDTCSRDRDQVVYRGTAPSPKLLLLHSGCTKDNPKKDKACPQCTENVKKVPRVVMVDQLWMWILDENTIITSFPKRWGRNKPDPSAVQKCIRTRLRAARVDEVRCVYDLGIIILDQVSRVFFDRTQPTDLQPQVIDSFANAIGKVTHKQTVAFDHFWECTQLVSKGYNSRDETAFTSVKKWQDTLLDINPEGDLLREIKDILDELFIITLIKTQEETVIRTFVKNCQRLQNWSNFGEIDSRSDRSSPGLGSMKLKQRRQSSLATMPYITLDQQYDPEDVHWTMICARELLDNLQDQLMELQSLRNAAENTSFALKDLLALKQQQAGVVEARESVKQGEESLRQGRSIMLFTIVTIIFLPLSFFTGVFGMNATDLTGSSGPGLYNWGDIFRFMIPISALIITCSLLLAFSKLVRAALSFWFNVAWAWLITSTPAYVRWRETHLTSKKLAEDETKIINRMKKKALQIEFERKERERRRKEGTPKEPASTRNSTSLQPSVMGLDDGDIEMGVRLR